MALDNEEDEEEDEGIEEDGMDDTIMEDGGGVDDYDEVRGGVISSFVLCHFLSPP